MAFLDNSGDIILDAILTSVGRKRMAQGRFRVTKFALGDDEINYALYDTTHASGSAYYDLEILQTPILEAMDRDISYGLASHTRQDLLYFPEIKLNELIIDSWMQSGSTYWFAVNSETYDKLKSEFGSENYVMQAGVGTSTKLIVEIGIDNTDLPPTKESSKTYLGSTNMVDRNVEVFVDNRFINTVMGPRKTATFGNTLQGNIKVNFGTLSTASPTSNTTGIKNYNSFIINGIANNITEVDSVDISKYTAIRGPKSTATAMSFDVPSELKTTSTGVASTKYSLYGVANTAVFGGSNLYSYIDTTVRLEGSTTSAQAQVPVRIIRYSGT
jgi:hypothetical protein